MKCRLVYYEDGGMYRAPYDSDICVGDSVNVKRLIASESEYSGIMRVNVLWTETINDEFSCYDSLINLAMAMSRKNDINDLKKIIEKIDRLVYEDEEQIAD